MPSQTFNNEGVLSGDLVATVAANSTTNHVVYNNTNKNLVARFETGTGVTLSFRPSFHNPHGDTDVASLGNTMLQLAAGEAVYFTAVNSTASGANYAVRTSGTRVRHSTGGTTRNYDVDDTVSGELILADV